MTWPSSLFKSSLQMAPTQPIMFNLKALLARLCGRSFGTIPLPQRKFFPWLICGDRVWTADRLRKSGWPDCDLCSLCRRNRRPSLTFFSNATSPMAFGPGFEIGYVWRTWALILGLTSIRYLNVVFRDPSNGGRSKPFHLYSCWWFGTKGMHKFCETIIHYRLSLSPY